MYQSHTAPLQVTSLSPFLQRTQMNVTLIILATSKQSITVVKCNFRPQESKQGHQEVAESLESINIL